MLRQTAAIRATQERPGRQLRRLRSSAGGAVPEDGADVCSRAEARVRPPRLTPLDRGNSSNQAYGTPIPAAALAAAAARGRSVTRSVTEMG
jgi:hypothetical protein